MILVTFLRSGVIGVSDSGYLIVIHPDATIEVVVSCGGAEEIHRLVGGFFENVYVPDFPVNDVVASVNEVGKLIGLPINPLATYIYGSPSDFIVGDFVLQKLERVGEYDELDQVPFSYENVKIILDILKIYKRRWLLEEGL